MRKSSVSGRRGGRCRRTARPRASIPGAGLLALLVVGGLVAGCRPQSDSTAAGGLTSEEFVEVVVALREAERAVADADSATARFARRKAEILARYETSEEELRAFMVERDRDVAALHEVWDTIAERLKYAPGVGDAAGDSAADTTGDAAGDAAADTAADTAGKSRDSNPLRLEKDPRSGAGRRPLDAGSDTAGEDLQATLNRSVAGERRLH